MDDTLRSFRKREGALRKKHIRMAHGYVTKMDKSGLIIQQPDRKVGSAGKRLLFYSVLVFLGFKVLLLSGLGIDAYSAHLDALARGSVYEQAGAWLMQIDPLTARLAGIVAPLLS